MSMTDTWDWADVAAVGAVVRAHVHKSYGPDVEWLLSGDTDSLSCVLENERRWSAAGIRYGYEVRDREYNDKHATLWNQVVCARFTLGGMWSVLAQEPINKLAERVAEKVDRLVEGQAKIEQLVRTLYQGTINMTDNDNTNEAANETAQPSKGEAVVKAMNKTLEALARMLVQRSVHRNAPETTVCFSVYLTADGCETGPASVWAGRREGTQVEVVPTPTESMLVAGVEMVRHQAETKED